MKKKKALWKRIVKWTLLSCLLLIVLVGIAIGVVMNFVFTPSRLTPVVERLAGQYLNADVQFDSIELTFFSTFPDVGLEVRNTTILSGVFRDSLKVTDARDSLISMKRCLVTMNPVAYMTQNKIIIKDFVLEGPNIYTYVDTLGVANWNIAKVSADSVAADTAVVDTLGTPQLDVKNVRIKNGKLIFDDRATQIYTRIDGLNMDIEGEFLGNTANLQLALTTQKVLFWQEGKLLVKRLVFGVETDMHVNRDSLLYRLDRAVFNVNGVKFGAGGILRADSVSRTIDVDLKYGIHIPTLKTLLDLIPTSIIKEAADVDVKGEVHCRGTIRGIYGKNQIPLLTSEFKIIDGYIAYVGMPSRIDTLNMDFTAVVDLQKQQPSVLTLHHFCVKGGDTDIDIVGDVEAILTAPVVKAKIDAVVNFDDITRIFPLADGVTCRGVLTTALKTDVLIQDVVDGNYGKLKLGGWCKMRDIQIFIPKDSIVMNVKSAGLGFASNRKNEKTVQGVDLLNGIVGYSGLSINIKNQIRLDMDTTYLTLHTSPVKDTSTIASVNSTLQLGRVTLIVRDTLLVGLKHASAKIGLKPTKKDKKLPRIEASIQVDSLRLRYLSNRLNMAKADISFTAVRDKKIVKLWHPKGYVDFEGLRAYTPYFPLRMRMSGTRINFDSKEIRLDSARLKVGRSDVRLTGTINNLTKALKKKADLDVELFVRSKMVDCNQLMKALDAGTAYAAKVDAGFLENIRNDGDDMDDVGVVSDTILYEGANSLFVVPAGINFKLQTDIDQILFGKITMDSIHGEIVMKDQTLELTDFQMRSSAANMDATVIYRANDTLRAYAGFALKMHDIRIDSLVRLVPSLDTLFPMLRSFEGEVDFHVSAEAWLDSTMTIELPTLRAAAYLDGHHLVLMDGETFSEISKMLMFKNKERNLIDSVSVDMTVKDGIVDIYPFMIEIDRYKVAVGGNHNIDMSFKYHVSLLKSPLPFRAGIDISGTLDKMKFKITKAKYKDIFLPSRKSKVDSTQLNLKKRVREVLRSHEH